MAHDGSGIFRAFHRSILDRGDAFHHVPVLRDRAAASCTLRSAVRMMTPVMNHYGLCLECTADTAHHMGVNAGFITFLKFSLAEDFCVAAMTNKYGIFSTKTVGAFSGAGNRLFDKAEV